LDVVTVERRYGPRWLRDDDNDDEGLKNTRQNEIRLIVIEAKAV